jgi:GT2 family glycosyltransferase
MAKELSVIAIAIDNFEITERFVSSIRQYTKGDYELILIDNASKDKKSINFIQKAADRSFRFNKRVSVAKAWNKGIELSHGKFIVIANNDVVVGPNWFRPLKETLAKHKNAGMVSPMTFMLIKGYFKWRNLKNFNLKKPFMAVKFKDVVWGEFCLFKRKSLEDVSGYFESYKSAGAEDLEMSFSLYSKGYEIWVDPRVFLYHQGGASHKFSKDLWGVNFKLFKSRWPKYTKGW